eukprot:16439-Eustigmatos_ZCMA.PRE.1
MTELSDPHHRAGRPLASFSLVLWQRSTSASEQNRAPRQHMRIQESSFLMCDTRSTWQPATRDAHIN